MNPKASEEDEMQDGYQRKMKKGICSPLGIAPLQ
jgi:hypothetical protein